MNDHISLEQLSSKLESIQDQLNIIQSEITEIKRTIQPKFFKKIRKIKKKDTEVEQSLKNEIVYDKLEQLLAQKKWLDADQETAKIFLMVLGRQQKGYLQDSEIYKLPCNVLQTIDQLWLNASKDQFGFSVQRQIYQDFGGNRYFNPELWRKFGKEVGWYLDENWLNYKQINFSDSAPKGHLPVMGDGRIWFVSNWEGSFTNFSTFLFRMIECKIFN